MRGISTSSFICIIPPGRLYNASCTGNATPLFLHDSVGTLGGGTRCVVMGDDVAPAQYLGHCPPP